MTQDDEYDDAMNFSALLLELEQAHLVLRSALPVAMRHIGSCTPIEQYYFWLNVQELDAQLVENLEDWLEDMAASDPFMHRIKALREERQALKA